MPRESNAVIGYRYRATLVRVIDGDTAVLNVDLGFRISITVSVRLIGIDAPESTAGDVHGAATARLTQLLNDGNPALVVETQRDKKSFDRYLGRIFANGTDVGEVLVEEGFAVRWTRS